MPYYTFNVYSTKKDILTKQFTTQDCIDLHFLLANEDFIGVDMFCQTKYEEYTKDNTKLNSFDKFLFLFSQKILSHSFDTNIIIQNKDAESKITKKTSLVKIYNEISEKIFILKGSYVEGCVEIEYGIPANLSSKNNVILYSLKTDTEHKVLSESDNKDLPSLPIKLYTQIQDMQLKNNEIIISSYFSDSFLRPLMFSNECFLYILNFIYQENVADYFSLSYNLNKEFNVGFDHIKTITMRELYLLVDTINKITQEKKKQKS